MNVKGVGPDEEFPFLGSVEHYICVGGLRLVDLFFTGVDEFPHLPSLENHLAEQRVLTLEVPPDDLSEEVDLGDQIRFGLQVFEGAKGRQLGRHLNI